MADFVVGSPVRDEDFWFREGFVDDLWEAMEKHNILLLAPRRIGKTSVMYRMLDYPKGGWLVIHLNVEDLKTPEDFFINLLDAINEHQPDYLRKVLSTSWTYLKGVLSRINKVEAYEFKIELRKEEDLKENWKIRLTELMDRVFNSGEKVLFIIDELPDMLSGILACSPDEYEDFLHWFRKLRDKSLKSSVRWMVGGSVNLTAALDKEGMIKLINDLKTEPLAPFNEKEVEQFVTEMLRINKVEFDKTVIPRIIELLGSPIPLFLQMLTQELYRKWKHDRSKPISAETVTDVFNKSLLGEMARDKLQHYRTRIDVHYAEEEREATCYLLNKLSLSEDGVSRNTLLQLYRQIEEKKTKGRTGPALNQGFQRLLLHLQSDFYIEEAENGNYDFASRLLKTWWKKYYGYESGEN